MRTTFCKGRMDFDVNQDVKRREADVCWTCFGSVIYKTPDGSVVKT